MAIVMDWSTVIILFCVSQRLLRRVVSKMRELSSLISKVGMLTCYQGINIPAMDTRVDVGVMIHIFVHNSMMTHIEREIRMNIVMVNNMVIFDHMGHMVSKNVITRLLLMMGFRGGRVLRLMVGRCLFMMTFCSLGVSMTSFFLSFGRLGRFGMLVSFSGFLMLLVLSWLSGGLVLFGGLCGVGVVITLAIDCFEGVS